MKDASELLSLLGAVPGRVDQDPWVAGDPIRFEVSTESKEDDAIARHIVNRLNKDELTTIRAIIGEDHLRWADLGERIYFAIQKVSADA